MPAEYLYVLGVGPVQGFISAARRTRDLWMGSHLLSEISKAAARKIDEAGGTLIFPSLFDLEEMKTNHKIKHAERLSPSYAPDAFNVANIVRAIIPNSDPDRMKKLNTAVQDAAQKEWKNNYAGKARAVLSRIPDAIDTDIWDIQVKDVIEFYAAWVPIAGQYDDAQKRVMRLFGSRKALRNFEPSPATDDVQWRVEKCSLDGARESVIRKKTVFPREVGLRLRLNPGEQLCAVALTKRIGGNTDRAIPFPSVVRVALDPWIRGIVNSGDDRAIALLKDIAKKCEGDNTFSSGTGERNGRKFYSDFPFDGQVLFQSRLKDLKKDLAGDPDYQTLVEIDGLATELCACDNGHRAFGEPNPYYAILVADGDRMGKVISYIKSDGRHQIFSATLAAFAGSARTIVENEKHRGVMVYAGGEDILAFLPVDTCIAAARALHDKFGELLKANDFKDEDGRPATLSVGIAIGHSKDPLEDILSYGHDAEKDAKNPDRDGLAIHYHIRGGGDPINIREAWIPKDMVDLTGKSVKGSPLDERLNTWVELFIDEKIPDGAAYDLRQLAEDYRGWKLVPGDLLEKDVKRLLKRKRVSEDEVIDEKEIRTILAGVTSYSLLVRRADELILARKIAESAIQAKPKEEKGTVAA